MGKYLEKEKAIDTLARLYEHIKREEHDQEAANGVWRAIEAIASLDDAWIPVAERLPEKEVRVLVAIMHHKWITDPGHSDQCIHPEWFETCEARRIGEEDWEYADQECEYEMITAFSDIEGLDHIYPIDEVLAWMPMPETYKEAEG